MFKKLISLAAKRPKNLNQEPPLFLKDNDSAFEYALQFLGRPLDGKDPLFGQIISKNEGSIASTYEWQIRLATDKGVFETRCCGSIHSQIAGKVGLKDTRLREGDLVGVKVARYDPEFDNDSPMQYFIIVCKLQPAVDPVTRILIPDV